MENSFVFKNHFVGVVLGITPVGGGVRVFLTLPTLVETEAENAVSDSN
jgi:hypothetical protein